MSSRRDEPAILARTSFSEFGFSRTPARFSARSASPGGVGQGACGKSQTRTTLWRLSTLQTVSKRVKSGLNSAWVTGVSWTIAPLKGWPVRASRTRTEFPAITSENDREPGEPAEVLVAATSDKRRPERRSVTGISVSLRPRPVTDRRSTLLPDLTSRCSGSPFVPAVIRARPSRLKWAICAGTMKRSGVPGGRPGCVSRTRTSFGFEATTTRTAACANCAASTRS